MASLTPKHASTSQVSALHSPHVVGVLQAALVSTILSCTVIFPINYLGV